MVLKIRPTFTNNGTTTNKKKVFPDRREKAIELFFLGLDAILTIVSIIFVG